MLLAGANGRERFGAGGNLKSLHNRELRSYPQASKYILGCFWMENFGMCSSLLIYLLLFLHSLPLFECLCLLFLFMRWVFADRAGRKRKRSCNMSFFVIFSGQ